MPQQLLRRHIAVVRYRFSVVLVPLIAACSSGQMVLPRATDTIILGQLPRPVRPRNVLYQDEVVATVNAGMLAFLRKVDVTALTHRDTNGQPQFDGYLILALRPASDWMSFDFVPGDVVTHVNGTFLGQHYNALLPLFEGLVGAKFIDVSLRRGGENLSIRVRIEPRTATSQ